MKRNLDAPLLALDGTPFSDGATLKSVIFMVLNATLEDDNKQSVDARMKQFGLIKLVHEGGVVDLKAEDIAAIKTRGAKVLSTMAFGVMCELLEAEYVEEKAE